MSPYRVRPMDPQRLRWRVPGIATNCLFESRCERFTIWKVSGPNWSERIELEDRRRRKPILCKSVFAAKKKAKAILADEWYGDRAVVKPRKRSKPPRQSCGWTHDGK